MFSHENYPEVPDYTLQGLDRWAKEGSPRPGDFITAVITNDLEDAVAHADGNNKPVIHRIVQYLWSELPSGCYGSKEAVDRWRDKMAGRGG